MKTECIQTDIRPRLKDPTSLRVLDTVPVKSKEVEGIGITYTATNSFGGRIQHTRVCTFKNGSLYQAISMTPNLTSLGADESDWIRYQKQ